MVGAGISFIVAFAVMLGANSIEVGLLSALPALLGAWAQLFSIKILDFYKSRKKLIMAAVFFQAISWIPIMIIPFIIKENSVFWVIIFYTIGTVFGSIGAPAWQSWMKSITPQKIIGKYFGIRNSIIGAIALITMLSAGFTLNFFTQHALLVYTGIFGVSLIGRMCSNYFFSKISEPEPEKEEILPDEKTTFKEFAKDLLKTNFGYFVLFGSLMTFGLSLTGPFLSFYWLNYLGLKSNYLLYTIILGSSAVSALLSMPYWGKLIDRYGVRKILKATSYLAISFPILIILVRAPEWIILVEILNGVIFSGFNLALASFIYKFSGESRIMRYASYQAVFFGTSAFLGTIISGFIQSFEFSFWIINTSFYLVCLISIIVRFISYKSLINKIKEERAVEYIESKKIVQSILTFTPLRETVLSNTFELFIFGTEQIKHTLYGTARIIDKVAEQSIEDAKKIGEIGYKGIQHVSNKANVTIKRIEELSEESLEEVGEISFIGLKHVKNTASITIKKIGEIGVGGMGGVKKIGEIGNLGLYKVKKATIIIGKESIEGTKKIGEIGNLGVYIVKNATITIGKESANGIKKIKEFGSKNIRNKLQRKNKL